MFRCFFLFTFKFLTPSSNILACFVFMLPRTLGECVPPADVVAANDAGNIHRITEFSRFSPYSLQHNTPFHFSTSNLHQLKYNLQKFYTHSSFVNFYKIQCNREILVELNKIFKATLIRNRLKIVRLARWWKSQFSVGVEGNSNWIINMQLKSSPKKDRIVNYTIEGAGKKLRAGDSLCMHARERLPCNPHLWIIFGKACNVHGASQRNCRLALINVADRSFVADRPHRWSTRTLWSARTVHLPLN